MLFERNAMQTALKNYDDEMLHDAAGAIFFAYLHRLQHYVTTRNSDVDELQREPFTGTMTSRASLWSRIKRRVLGAKTLASIDDPLTAMQFRAFDWIVAHGDRIARKRADVQRTRVRTDREIFEKFPLAFVPTYPGDESLLGSALFRALRPRAASVDRVLSEIIQL